MIDAMLGTLCAGGIGIWLMLFFLPDDKKDLHAMAIYFLAAVLALGFAKL